MINNQDSTKPVFLTKQQREKLALERREREVEEQRQRQEQARQSLNRFTSAPSSSSSTTTTTRDIISDKSYNYQKYQSQVESLKEKKAKRISEKRFNFEWDAEEDTSAIDDPLYANRSTSIMFGRGHFGGGISATASSNGQDTRIRADSSLDKYGNKPSQKSRDNLYMDLYWRDKPLDRMTQRDWRIMREDFAITTKGGNVPNPLRTWSESSQIPPTIVSILLSHDYDEPTPIQRQAIPIALAGRDLIGVAQTGSGKTFAFLVPMMTFLSRLPRLSAETAHDGPYCLILVPTRELAIQIENEAEKFTSILGYRSLAIVGGHSMETQASRLRQGCEIIIATPGRLKDCLDRRILVFNQCTYVVMDEADRMVVDMGFEEDLDYILGMMPVEGGDRTLYYQQRMEQEQQRDEMMDYNESYGNSTRGYQGYQRPSTTVIAASQKKGEKEPENMLDERGIPKYRTTIMFSATMPQAVERIAKTYMRSPLTVMIGDTTETTPNVTQKVEFTSEDRKLDRLFEVLSDERYRPPIIIFVKQKIGVDSLAKTLENEGGFRVASLHGGKSQENRESALRDLKSGRKDILVATDVAGRGIDVPDVSLVINYEMPKTIEDYTHRIGRTGRAGKHGVAISFITNDDAYIFYDLKMYLIKTNNPVPRELARHEAAKQKPSETGRVPQAKRKHEETIYLN